MSNPAPASFDAAGSRWIVSLLFVAILLTAALAWQAQDAARSHRQSVEDVLREDARFAGREFLRRAASEVDYFAFYPVVYVFAARERAQPGGAVPDPIKFASLDRNLGRSPSLLRHLFRMDTVSQSLQASAGTPAELLDWARAALPGLFRDAPKGGVLAVSTATVAGVPRTIIYGVSPMPEQRYALACDVDVRELSPYLQKTIDGSPLLPARPAAARPANGLVHMELRDQWDREIFRTAGRFDSALGISENVTDRLAGVFRGMKIRASLDPGAAGQLIAGGLPRSRLPLLLGTLLLTAGLLVAAILQVGRERALARLRADFVSGVSHELRTPLAQIRLFAETLLLDRVRSPEERRRSLEIIDQEARRLTLLVENTLQFSRAEGGGTRLTPPSRELAPLVSEILEAFAPLADGRARVVSELPAGVSAPVDADALRQVLGNLLDNAVKYGPAGQRILVRLANRGDTVSLSVEDEGPGIPEPERRRIWERFVRLDRDRETHRAGTGIGLSVVRDLVELHGGSVRVEEGESGGARFVVSLPRAAGAA